MMQRAEAKAKARTVALDARAGASSEEYLDDAVGLASSLERHPDGIQSTT